MNSWNYSVIVGELPDAVDSSILYLQYLKSAFRAARRIYAVMPDERLHASAESDLFMQMVDEEQITIILSHESAWDGINRAVAESETEHVVILEREMWPARRVESAWFSEFRQNSTSVLYFEKRQSYEDVASISSDRTYSRSSPELTFTSSNAYVIERKVFLELRGYDERSPYRDFADIDFRIRLIRARENISQMRGPDAVAYFPPSASRLGGTNERELASEKASIAKIERDKSIYRNLVHWSVPTNRRIPLVTVAIATKDRGAMLADALYSVLFQTFQDFEVIVVDDGSESDDAEEVVRRIGDPRIHYIYQAPAGISAARNRAADESNCALTAVHDDDDIMLPDRLEVGLSSITSPFQATFGGWINFGDGNGQMKEFYGKLVFDSNVNAHNGQGPGHATWTVPTQLVQQFRYDERLTASVDHNLATRMEIAGVEWIHTGHFMYLRRVHDSQVTALDSGGQKVGHNLSRYLSNMSCSPDQLDELRAVGKSTKYPRIHNVPELLSSFRAYLPDKLVNRQVRIEGNTQNLQFDADVPDKMALLVEDRDIVNNRNMFECAILEDITLKDVATFRNRGLNRYSWIVEKSVGDSDLRNTLSAEYDLEDLNIKQSDDRVSKSLKSRVSIVCEKLLEQYPQGGLLVVENDEPYSNWVETELTRDAVVARRILVAGEFGVKLATRLYLYRTAAKGKEILAHLSNSSTSINPLLISQ